MKSVPIAIPQFFFNLDVSNTLLLIFQFSTLFTCIPTRKDGQSIDNVVFFRILCETIKDFITKVSDVGVLRGDKNLNEKCCYLKSKLSHLLDVLKDEQLLFHDPYSVIEIFVDFTISTLQTVFEILIFSFHK